MKQNVGVIEKLLWGPERPAFLQEMVDSQARLAADPVHQAQMKQVAAESRRELMRAAAIVLAVVVALGIAVAILWSWGMLDEPIQWVWRNMLPGALVAVPLLATSVLVMQRSEWAWLRYAGWCIAAGATAYLIPVIIALMLCLHAAFL